MRVVFASSGVRPTPDRHLVNPEYPPFLFNGCPKLPQNAQASNVVRRFSDFPIYRGCGAVVV